MAERKRCLSVKDDLENSPPLSPNYKRSKYRTPLANQLHTTPLSGDPYTTPKTKRVFTPTASGAPKSATATSASRFLTPRSRRRPSFGQHRYSSREFHGIPANPVRTLLISEKKLQAPAADSVPSQSCRFSISSYFSHRKKAVRRSERNFSDLRIPRLSQRQFDEAKPNKNKAMKEEEKERIFKAWSQQIWIGHNLLVYGFGSKFELLEEFGNSKYCKDGAVSAVDAFNGISPEEVVRRTAKVYFEDEDFEKEVVDAMIERLAKDERKIYILVHGIDSPCFRSKEAQGILGRLAQCPNVTMVASLDNVNGGLLWDTEMHELFEWSMCAVHTCQHYFHEASDRPILLNPTKKNVGSEGHEAEKALLVLRSFVTNAQQVFLVLAAQKFEPLPQSQPLKAGSSANVPRKSLGMLHSAGLTFEVLYKRCRERFLVSDASVLRSHIEEFISHDLIRKQKDAAGDNAVFAVRLDGEALEKVVSDLSS